MDINKKIGVIIKSSHPKTRTVRIIKNIYNSKYNNFIRNSKPYLVHDEQNVTKEGDIVVIQKIAPISKKKHWKIKIYFEGKI